MQEEDVTISHEVPESEQTAPIVASDTTLSSPTPETPGVPIQVMTRRKVWGGRTFRFNPRNFLPDGNFSLRRFSIVEATLLLMVALLASRGLGVVRQMLFNAMFGTGPEANAYYAAARLPDTLFNLIAGGALIHAFIPVFLSHEKDHGKREAWQLASLVFNIMLVALTLFTLICEILTPTFVNTIIVPGYSHSEQELTTSLTRIILFQPLILGLGTVLTAILNGKRQFLLPALSIAVYNFGMIGGLLVSLVIPGVGIYGATYGILVAALLQSVVQVPALIKQGFRYSFVWNIRNPGLRDVMKLLIPNVLAVVIASIGFIVDTAFSSYLPDSSSLAAIHNAQLLYSLPDALVAQAIGLSLLPHLAAQAATKSYFRMRQTALKVMGAGIGMTIPATLVLWLLGKPIILLLFQHGAFTAHSSELTYLALSAYSLGLPGIIAGELLTNGFFALKDTTTPLITGMVSLTIRCVLILLLLRVFQGIDIILAIPLALSVAATTEAVLMGIILMVRLSRRVTLDQGLVRLQSRRSYQEQQALALTAKDVVQRTAQEENKEYETTR
jgi:putative peptidoglycan lipid II flippase